MNDCSKDDTEKIVLEYKDAHSEIEILYYRHDVNKGKGAALHTGIKEAKGDLIIVQDADLEYDPNEFNLLLKPVLDGFADVVYGSRFIGGNAHRILFFWHSIGNKVLTFMSNALDQSQSDGYGDMLQIVEIRNCKKSGFKRKTFWF